MDKSFGYHLDYLDNLSLVEKKEYIVLSPNKQIILNQMLNHLSETELSDEELDSINHGTGFLDSVYPCTLFFRNQLNLPESCILKINDVLNVTYYNQTLLVLEPQAYDEIVHLDNENENITDYCSGYIQKNAKMLGVFGNSGNLDLGLNDWAVTGSGDNEWYIVNDELYEMVLKLYEMVITCQGGSS